MSIAKECLQQLPELVLHAKFLSFKSVSTVQCTTGSDAERTRANPQHERLWLLCTITAARYLEAEDILGV